MARHLGEELWNVARWAVGVAVALQAFSALAQGPQRRGAVQPAAAIDPRALDELLLKWERESAKIRDMEAEFRRITYDPVFGGKEGEEGGKELAYGKLLYLKPDKGIMEITPHGEKKPSETWICTGLAVYEVKPKIQHVIIHELPPEQQGQNISEGPLPFIFGLNADKAKKRYQLTLLSDTPEEALLHVLPREKQDAQNFSEAYLLVDKKTFTVRAVRTVEPNRMTIDYIFDRTRTNSGLRPGQFGQPPFPPGWKVQRDRPAGARP